MNTRAATNEKRSPHRQKLALVATQQTSALEHEVATYILKHNETDTETESFLHDLATYGCVSGMVSELVYYIDTHAFFDRHYEEIENLRVATEEGLGEALHVKTDLKNSLAWFAFEETALRLARELLYLDI